MFWPFIKKQIHDRHTRHKIALISHEFLLIHGMREILIDQFYINFLKFSSSR